MTVPYFTAHKINFQFPVSFKGVSRAVGVGVGVSTFGG